MKTNEVPERIYIVIDPVWGSMSVNYNRNDTNNIEYTRTDAFIEKADKFIGSFFHPDNTELKKSILNEFHKYMKGEEV